MPPRYRTAFRKLLPRHFTRGEGELVLSSLAELKEGWAERAYQGLNARFPSTLLPSALSSIGRDRKIVRGINEPDEAYAERQRRWLDDHRVRGNMFALMDQLRAYCQADVRIRTVDASGNWCTRERDGARSWLIKQLNWDWDGKPRNPYFSRFWVIIYPTSAGEPWAPNEVWGDPALWDAGIFGTAGKTIGTTATPEQIASVRSIVREWQPDGTRCEWIIIAFDDASFDPTDTQPPLPDGTWGKWGKYDGSGNYVSARLESARYIRGVKGAPYP